MKTSIIQQKKTPVHKALNTINTPESTQFHEYIHSGAHIILSPTGRSELCHGCLYFNVHNCPTMFYDHVNVQNLVCVGPVTYIWRFVDAGG